MSKINEYNFSWHFCNSINSAIGFGFIFFYLIWKKERFRGRGKYINRLVLIMSFNGIIEMLLRLLEVHVYQVYYSTGLIEKNKNNIVLVYNFLTVLVEILNSFIILILTVSLFLAIVMKIPVLDIEYYEKTVYAVMGMVSLALSLLLFTIRETEVRKESNSGSSISDIYNRITSTFAKDAIIFHHYLYLKSFVIFILCNIIINAVLYAIILNKCSRKQTRKSSKSNALIYSLTIGSYYIAYVLKWIYFIIAFFIYSNNNGNATGLMKYKHYTDKKSKSYNIATCLTCLQGFFLLFNFWR